MYSQSMVGPSSILATVAFLLIILPSPANADDDCVFAGAWKKSLQQRLSDEMKLVKLPLDTTAASFGNVEASSPKCDGTTNALKSFELMIDFKSGQKCNSAKGEYEFRVRMSAKLGIADSAKAPSIVSGRAVSADIDAPKEKPCASILATLKSAIAKMKYDKDAFDPLVKQWTASLAGFADAFKFFPSTTAEDQKRIVEVIGKSFIKDKEIPVVLRAHDAANMYAVAQTRRDGDADAGYYKDQFEKLKLTFLLSAKLLNVIASSEWQFRYGTAPDSTRYIMARTRPGTKAKVCFGDDKAKCPAGDKQPGEREAWCQLLIEVESPSGKPASKIDVGDSTCTFGSAIQRSSGEVAMSVIAEGLSKLLKAGMK